MKLRHLVSAVLLGLLVVASLSAQQTPQQSRPSQRPQSREQAAAAAEQEQALQVIQQATKPEEVVVLIEQFLQKYPESPYTWGLCRRASESYRQMNNYAKAIEYGERAVVLNPQDPLGMILVADALAEGSSPNAPDFEEKLARGERYARQALELLPEFLSKLPPPPSLTPEQMEVQKKLAEAQPHATLGYIHLLRKENAEAEQELVKAIELAAAQPNQMDYLRLGRAYYLQDKYEEAIATFRKAVAMGGALYETAQRHLQAAEEALAKRQRAAPPSPESKPPAPKPPAQP